jgi:hypothetical protein
MMQKSDLMGILNKDFLKIRDRIVTESSPTEVLETMRNLIVELQVFKADNEKLKKAQQEQQEINEVLLQYSDKENPKG